ncbi:MAG TPA: hypothetical protein VF188_09040 [Longimicrobiales bacterium]
MAIRAYTIWIDGRAYGGEDPDVLEAAPALNGGWYDNGPTTVNGIKIGGEPYAIEGRLNLRSHLERIIRRLDRLDPVRIEIRREENDA